MGVPAGLISFGNNSSPSGQVTDNLSGSLLLKQHINVSWNVLIMVLFFKIKVTRNFKSSNFFPQQLNMKFFPTVKSETPNP